ncbi:Low-density lipoprotein receptor-related protein 2-like 3, partial [Homarus americanus]
MTAANIVKRQAEGAGDEAEAFALALCSDKGAGEWFRLAVTDCRDVIQCTDAGLQALRCPHGLAFDLELQTCDWGIKVTNCNEKVKTKKENQLACGNGECIERILFCDGKNDCIDESDENAC